MEYFLTPQQVMEQFSELKKDRKIRVGGLVIPGSIIKFDNEIHFSITDNFNIINVEYKGIVTPPIFKENVGVIARGYLIDKENFVADQLIGKHDENYMPSKYEKK